MAFSHGKKTGLSIVDAAGATVYLTPWTNSVDAPVTIDSAETTIFNTSNMRKTFLPGNAEQNVSLSGVWATTPDGKFFGIIASSSATTLKIFPNSTAPITATNFMHYDGSANLTSYDVSMGIDGEVTWTADFQFTGTVTRATSAPS